MRARAIRKSKPLKTGMVGALLEVDVGKICTTPARDSDLEVKIVKNWEPRSTFGSWSRQNLHHAWGRERFGSQNRKKLSASELFWKLKSPKFAPRLRARAIWKSKSLQHRVLGTFLDLQTVFRVAGAGISTNCKIRGRRRSSWGSQKRWQAWWIWRGSETMRFAWQAQGFRAFWCRCLKAPTQNPWKSCKFHVTELLLCSDHFAWQLQDLGSTFSWQAQYFWSIHLKIAKTYWNSEVKSAQHVIFEGSLAKMLWFWSWKLHFWRKSRAKASFLSFKDSILKEVSHKSFVFDLQSFVFEGSLAQNLCFWASKRHFWRKSRRKATLLSFKASFWRKSRRKASFDKIIWITHQLTTKSLEPQTIWHPNHLNLKSIDNQLIWISNRLTTKSLESQMNWQPNRLNLKSIDNHITWSSNQQTTKIIWSTHRLTTTSFEAHIDWQPNQLNLKSIDNQNHLNLTSLESDINSFSIELNSAHPLPIGSLSLETSATALCGRYVIADCSATDTPQKLHDDQKSASRLPPAGRSDFRPNRNQRNDPL